MTPSLQLPVPSGGSEPDPDELARRPWIVVGDAHLHAQGDEAVASDLARLIRSVPGEAVVVFNGDLFNLDRVRGEPSAGVGANHAVDRVRRVLDRFSGLEVAMREHVARGGLLLFVAGNHDAELLLPEVGCVLSERLGGTESPRRVFCVERLEAASIAVEHGHQVDPDAAFFPTMQSAVAKQRLSAMPLASLMTRLFVSNHPSYEAATLHYETPLVVLRAVLHSYKLAGLWMTLAYPFVAARVAWHSLLGTLRRDVPANPSPVTMSSPWKVVRRLYLDRYMATVAALASASAIALCGLRSGLWWLPAVLTAYLIIPPMGRRAAYGERDLRSAAQQATHIAELGARVVVFGHTHRAFVQSIGAASYANHGAFSIPVEIDDAGRVCGDGRPASDRVDPSRRARPYLTISFGPVACELRGLPVSEAGKPSAAGVARGTTS